MDATYPRALISAGSLPFFAVPLLISSPAALNRRANGALPTATSYTPVSPRMLVACRPLQGISMRYRIVGNPLSGYRIQQRSRWSFLWCSDYFVRHIPTLEEARQEVARRKTAASAVDTIHPA